MEKKFTLLVAAALLLSACATPRHKSTWVGSTHAVRTTAYTQTEKGGAKNALGSRLASGQLNSAAADWSRFPLGTKFKILCTGEIFRIDDYGSALIGTDTIDLFKSSRSAMQRWGARQVDIQILEWGSPQKSLQVLKPRARNPKVRRMIVRLCQNS